MSASLATEEAALRAAQVPAKPVQRPLDLLPVGLKEAALDSPTFRATAAHFGDNLDLLERWLDGYVRQASKLASEIAALESTINAMVAASAPPTQISEAVLDHDYTLLAVRRYGEGARDFWQDTLKNSKSLETTVIEPVKKFLNNDIRTYKETRRNLETCQRSFDSTLTRYVAQSKNKEASSLREDAFQLHESRKAYLKASLDVSMAAPLVRSAADKLLVRVFTDRWKEMRAVRDASATTLETYSSEMERIRGWSRELENSERVFNKELLTARQQVEENALAANKPTREIDGYSTSAVTYMGATLTSSSATAEMSEKQGWLFVRTVTGKPSRTLWIRRWYFVQNGIFSWLSPSVRSGGVEESDKIGVLLCGVRPWFQEERRFCFEVKTKDTSIILQAETQQELTEWITAFEVAKRKALGSSTSTLMLAGHNSIDPAFAVTAPVATEFAVNQVETGAQDDSSNHLNVADSALPGTLPRASTDINFGRRVPSTEKDSEYLRDPTSRLISKLDTYKRAVQPSSAAQQSSLAGNGIASLISASHNVLPIGPVASSSRDVEIAQRYKHLPVSTLAPSTLVNCPSMTGLSHTAIVLSGEKGLGLEQTNGSGTPSSLLANIWGSKYWGYVSHVDDHIRPGQGRKTGQLQSLSAQEDPGRSTATPEAVPSTTDSSLIGNSGHRKAQSEDLDATYTQRTPQTALRFPLNYPVPLQAQHAQFRVLFPNADVEDKLVLVFRATWNPNEQQEFPGRVYVTSRRIYFFSNHLGLVLTTAVELTEVEEVTAAPGRDCDYLYFHLRQTQNQQDPKRLTIKVFLEPLRLLQRRLNYVAKNASAEQPDDLSLILKTFVNMEKDNFRRRSSVESWEDLTHVDRDHERANRRAPVGRVTREESDVKAPLRIDGTLYGDLARTGREVQRFKLPRQPIVYVPKDMQTNVGREFAVSAKALFHVMFGDKSVVFQLRYATQLADHVVQTSWTRTDAKAVWRRRFSAGSEASFEDLQAIDIFNDHLCYVVSSTRLPSSLPFANRMQLNSKYIVTHVGKSRAKLSICHKIIWKAKAPTGYIRRLVEDEIIDVLSTDAMELINVAVNQVVKLGKLSKTIRAVEIFGDIGKQITVPVLDAENMPAVASPSPVKIATTYRAKSVPRLVLDDIFSRFLKGLSWIFETTLTVSKLGLSLLSVHRILAALLMISILYNSWFSYRESLAWYKDRQASSFMHRVGVRPESVISKTVYLKDMETFLAPPALSALLNGTNPTTKPDAVSATTCSTKFQSVVSAAANDTHSAIGLENVGYRVRRSRELLGQRRHDLLVALRMVNRVERDVIQSEWLMWLDNEKSKCEHINSLMLRSDSGENASRKHARKAIQEYCATCLTERSRTQIASGLI